MDVILMTMNYMRQMTSHDYDVQLSTTTLEHSR